MIESKVWNVISWVAFIAAFVVACIWGWAASAGIIAIGTWAHVWYELAALKERVGELEPKTKACEHVWGPWTNAFPTLGKKWARQRNCTRCWYTHVESVE